MGEWKTVKLAEVLRYRKGNILINNDEEYSLCRVQLHRRGVVLREKKMGSQIKTKKQQVCRASDLVVAEMDAKFGGYGFIPDHLEGAIVSSHYYLYELDKNKITQQYFEILIKTDFIQNQIEAKGSTNYSSIRAWEFLDYEIPLQSIALQNIIAAKYLKHSRFKEDLGIEINTQLKYLSQLRQRILQEAIEGKLTFKWRDKHPDLISGDNHASKLLGKIKAEKERLIKEGKIKKDKPLAPIADAEKPFDLPEGWAWCRLEEISQIKGGKRVSNGYKLLKNPTPHIYIRVSDMKNWSINDSDLRYIDEEMYQQIRQYTISKNDLYMTIVGATIGKCGIVPEMFDNMNLTENAAKIIVYLVNKYFLLYCLNGDFCQNQFIDKTKQVGVQKMALNRFSTTLVPLPPPAEQIAIVERIDKLMLMIDKLEKQVSERKEQSEMLMQSVLREAFAKG